MRHRDSRSGSRRSGPHRLGLFVVLFAAFTGMAGCYTVLKHPPAADVAQQDVERQDCYACHGPGGPSIPLDPLYTPGYDYYPANWYAFYGYPWWWKESWYDDVVDDHGGVGSDAPPSVWSDDSERHFYGRGTAYVPPSVPPVQPGGPALGGSSPTSGSPDPPSPPNGQQAGRSMKGDAAPPPPPSGGNTGGNSNPPPTHDSKKDDGGSKQRQEKDKGGSR